MGMWSFVKGAGKSLLGSKAEAATVPEAEALKKEVADLGLDTTGIDIKVELIAYEEFYPKWMAAIESKRLPDVSFFGYQEVGQFYGKGILRDISGLYRDLNAKSPLYGSLVEAVTFGGKQYEKDCRAVT